MIYIYHISQLNVISKILIGQKKKKEDHFRDATARSRLHGKANQGWQICGRETKVSRTRFGDLHIRTIVRTEINLLLSCPAGVCAFKRAFDISGVACATRRQRINLDFSHFVFLEKICEWLCSQRETTRFNRYDISPDNVKKPLNILNLTDRSSWKFKNFSIFLAIIKDTCLKIKLFA